MTKTNKEILEEIEDTWEEVKDNPMIELNPKAIEWLIEQAEKAKKYEEVLQYYAEKICIQQDDIGVDIGYIARKRLKEAAKLD